MLALTVAWRNLWRNKRRTFLTAGAIAFAVLLIQLGMSFQSGSYGPMVEVGTRFGSGHLQIQHSSFKDNPRIDYLVADATQLKSKIEQVPGVVAVSIRSEAFALVNNDERSFGALIIGVDPELERATSYFPDQLIEGTYLDEENDAYIGSALARNLDLSVGDELVVLSTDIDGSVAVMALQVGGIFQIGNDLLDRSLIQVRFDHFNEAFRLGDGAHRIVILVHNPMDLETFKFDIDSITPANAKLYDWHELMPEISQNIQLDKVSNAIVYGTLTVIVVLSIANTFVMTMFERTREFGVLKAMGMRNNSLFSMFLIESILLWSIGVLAGFCLSACVIFPLGIQGIGMDSMGMDEFAGMMFLPDRIHPNVDAKVVLVSPIGIGIGIVAATIIASLRLYRLSLVEALRYKE